MDPFDGIPAALAREIQQTQAAEVAGGRAQNVETGSGSARAAQRRISRMLRCAGVHPKTDGRWERVIARGRDRYYGRAKA